MSASPELRVTLGADPSARLDKALAAAVPEDSGLSRSRLQALIAEGAVARPDGEVLRDAKMRVWPGEQVVLTLPPPVPARAEAQDIPLDIRFEDAHLVVLMKPAGLVVHPAPGAYDGTLVNALLHHCGDSLSGIGGARRPGIVHRIDKDTSGLLVVAKDDVTHQGLAAQFVAHDVERRYLAVCRGVPDPADPRLGGLPGVVWEPDGGLRIAGNIGRHGGDRKRMAVVRGAGKPAVTRARVLEAFGRAAALIECRLETGRTHQIRVHLAYAGHPLVGDSVYGGRGNPGTVPAFSRQALHAARLGFVHPVTGEPMRFDAAAPADFAGLLTQLRRSVETAAFNDP